MEAPARVVMSPAFFSFAILSTSIISVLGSVCNIFLLFKFITQKEKHSTGFQKISMVKTIANSLICLSFICWVVPITMMNYTYSQVHYVMNRAVGVVAPTWAYVLNSNLQVCLSCNRFYALYFPFGIQLWKSLPVANISISISIAITSLFTLTTIPIGCGYMYDPSLFLWRGEYADCSKNIGFLFPLIILITTATTSLFNVAIGVKLLVMKIRGLSEENVQKRRKRWMRMFTQSVLQDCLQLFDTFNSYYIVLLSDAVWFQFLFVTLSLVTISTLDGLIMFMCHSDFHPNWFSKKKMIIPAVTVTVGFQDAFKIKTEDVWRPLNVGIAQIAASGGYIFGPLCQICMAANRCLILYFPMWKIKFDKVPTTNLAVLGCFLASLLFSVVGMNGHCALIYHPDNLAWSPESHTCTDSMDGWMLPLVILISFVSIFLNMVAVLKLVHEKVKGITELQKARRRSRWLAMFVQNVIQDALHVFDMINYTFIYKLLDAEWFQFLFLSLSFALIYTLDGLVMVYFQGYCNTKNPPKALKNAIVAAKVLKPRQK